MTFPASGKIRSFDYSLTDTVQAPRWIYEIDKPSSAKGAVSQLSKLKKAQLSKKWDQCYKQGESVLKSAPGLVAWIRFVQLDCLNNWGNASRQGRQNLRAVLASVEKSKLLNDSWSRKILLPNYLDSQFLLLSKEVSSGSRGAAWVRIEKIQELESELSKKQMGDLLFQAGELAFVEQKLMGAYNFFLRSQSYKKRSEITDKLAIIKKTLPALKGVGDELPKDVATTDKDLKFTEKELRLVNRMRSSMDNKDLVSAVEDGISIIKDFPGSENADWAEEQILSIYLGLVGQSDKRYELFRQKVLRYMKEADPKRLKRWARNAWARGAFDDAVLISEMALEKLSPHPDERKLLLLAAESAVSAGKYSDAEEFYKLLVDKHGGTNQAAEAIFRLGLLYYRQKNYSQSAFYLEKLLATDDDSDFQCQAMYWRWRAYQKLERKEVNAVAQELINRFPLTYYGLRAKAESSGGLLYWNQIVEKSNSESRETFLPQGKLKVSLSFTQLENQSWERLQLLMAAGWLEEARQEFQNLPNPITAEQKVIYAKVAGHALNHFQSITWLNEAWDEKPELRTLETVTLAFPFEFDPIIQEQAERYEVSPHLVRGLIRQESSFRPKAVSPSNAYGLMQIVPITAKDIAQFLKWKKPLNLPDDMFDVNQNIRFGSSYIARMINAFDGHVPLALAAYNAGIGRMRRWINQRPDLGIDEKSLDSSPESEIWIDELPWGETRHYVKAVLRNYLIYKMISENKITLENPVWKMPDNKVSSR